MGGGIGIEAGDRGALRLPALLSERLVLQRDEAPRFWGWARPAARVVIGIAGQSLEARADAEGRWSCLGRPPRVGGPFELTVESEGEALTVGDVLVGDVWLCSGQSNMILPLARVRDRYEAEVAASLGLPIRLFRVPDRVLFDREAEDLSGGSWRGATAETVWDFPALPWFFAAQTHRAKGIPIGIVCSAVGGAQIHSFLSEAALQAFPEALAELRRCRIPGLVEATQEADSSRIAAWEAELSARDLGLGPHPWQAEDLPDGNWDLVNLPSFWDESAIGPDQGAVWFRKDVALTSEFAGKPGRLFLGTLVDADTAWVNGTRVGSTSYQYPPRRYSLPPELLRAGKNSLVFRLVNSLGRGGGVAGKPYELRISDTDGRPERVIDISGPWRWRRGASAPPLPEQTFFLRKPAALFDGMISPILGARYKGVLWYQGESDAERPEGYRLKLEALVADWRRRNGQPRLPFLIVQLPIFGAPADSSGESRWAELRQAQLESLAIPDTALAVALDVGEWNDLHPENKLDLARRLALLARRAVYGEAIAAGGPRLRAIASRPFSGGLELALDFETEGSRLSTICGVGPLPFSVSERGGPFRPVGSRIEGSAVLIGPVAESGGLKLRYAWADNPTGPFLADSAGWPASPFERTIRGEDR
jgi:sialate O-acetylesterase